MGWGNIKKGKDEVEKGWVGAKRGWKDGWGKDVLTIIRYGNTLRWGNDWVGENAVKEKNEVGNDMLGKIRGGEMMCGEKSVGEIIDKRMVCGEKTVGL